MSYVAYKIYFATKRKKRIIKNKLFKVYYLHKVVV